MADQSQTLSTAAKAAADLRSLPRSDSDTKVATEGSRKIGPQGSRGSDKCASGGVHRRSLGRRLSRCLAWVHTSAVSSGHQPACVRGAAGAALHADRRGRRTGGVEGVWALVERNGREIGSVPSESLLALERNQGVWLSDLNCSASAVTDQGGQ
jgi:hypothetical protein